MGEQYRKSPCPQGTGPGGRGDRTEHKYINIGCQVVVNAIKKNAVGSKGRAMGQLDWMAVKKGHRHPEWNEGSVEPRASGKISLAEGAVRLQAPRRLPAIEGTVMRRLSGDC